MILPERAPVLGVPLRYFLLGTVYLTAMLLFAIGKAPLLAADYLHNQGTLVLTHLFTLGFAGSVVTGAVYQITPVLLFSHLRSERLANLHLLLHGLGVPLMIWGFWEYATWLTITGGSLVLTGALLFAWNLAATLRRVERWNWHGALMAVAMLSYLATLVWGVLLALNQRYGFWAEVEGALLYSHLTLGLLGWFGLMIVAVGLKLVPMFAPAAPLPDRLIAGVGGSLALGVLLVTSGLFWHPVLLWTGVALALSGLLGYTGALFYTYANRRSRSKLADFSVRFALTAALLLPLPALALLPAGRLPGGRMIQAGLLLLFALGFVGGTILGMLLRIIPFVVWLHRFRIRQTKQERIPFLHEMFHARLGDLTYYAWFAGVTAMAAGMAFQNGPLIATGAAVALVGLIAFGWAIAQVLRQVPHGAPALYPGGSR